MQPIERYALVTLLFLVVLVMVVALWDDGSTTEASAGDDQTVARVDETDRARAESARAEPSRRPTGAERGSTQLAPLTGLDDQAPSASRQTTRQPSGARQPAASSADLGGEASIPRPSGDREGTLWPERSSNVSNQASLQDAFRAGSSGPGQADRERRAGAGGASRPSDDVTLSAGVTRSVPRGSDSTRRRDPQRSPARSDRQDPQERSQQSSQRSSQQSSQRSSQQAPPRTTPRTEPSRSASAPASASAATGARDYVVRSGDTLERIARRELGDARAISAIAGLNGLTAPFTIYEGKTIKLPARSDVAKSGEGAKPRTAAPGGGRTVYTIRSGEVLSVVLQREFGTYKRSIGLVKELNPGLNVDRIIAGDTVVLPRADEIPGGAVKTAAAKPQPAAARPRAAVDPNNEFVVR